MLKFVEAQKKNANLFKGKHISLYSQFSLEC